MIAFDLNRQTPVPLYYQLQQQLRQEILDGHLLPGALLPPEPELAELANVSRFTVRQAVEQLVRMGLLRRERGRGTFVADESTEQQASGAYHFVHALDQEGSNPVIRVIRTIEKPASGAVSQLLPPSMSSTVHEVVRVREQFGKPTSVEIMLWPKSVIPDLKDIDLEVEHLYPALERRFSLHVGHAEEMLRASAARDELATLLGVSEGSAIFDLERRAWAGTHLMELCHTYIPGQLGLSRVLNSAEELCAV